MVQFGDVLSTVPDAVGKDDWRFLVARDKVGLFPGVLAGYRLVTASQELGVPRHVSSFFLSGGGWYRSKTSVDSFCTNKDLVLLRVK